MAFFKPGLTPDQVKQLPGLSQYDPGVFKAGDTYYTTGPDGTVQATKDPADFHIGQQQIDPGGRGRDVGPIPQPPRAPAAAAVPVSAAVSMTAGGGGATTTATDFWATHAPPGSPLAQPYVAPVFTPPTGITAQNDPGYEERRALGQRGLERSAAARGSILSGGFQEELARYNQDYASNEYGNVYGRALSTFNTNTQGALAGRQQNQGEYQNLVGNTMGARQQNFNEFQTGVMNTLGARQQNFGEYQFGVNSGLAGRQQNYGEYQGGVNNANTQYGNQYGAYLNENARKLNDYLTNAGIRRGAEQDLWGRYRDLYMGGLNAAGNTGP